MAFYTYCVSRYPAHILYLLCVTTCCVCVCVPRKVEWNSSRMTCTSATPSILHLCMYIQFATVSTQHARLILCEWNFIDGVTYYQCYVAYWTASC